MHLLMNIIRCNHPYTYFNCQIMGEIGPYLAVIIIQLIYSGMTLLSKAAFNGGMKTSVFVFYRQIIGTIILVPLAFIFER